MQKRPLTRRPKFPVKTGGQKTSLRQHDYLPLGLELVDEQVRALLVTGVINTVYCLAKLAALHREPPSLLSALFNEKDPYYRSKQKPCGDEYASFTAVLQHFLICTRLFSLLKSNDAKSPSLEKDSKRFSTARIAHRMKKFKNGAGALWLLGDGRYDNNFFPLELMTSY
jgi:hypothetical protein